MLSSPGLSCPAFFVLSLLCLVFVFDVVLASFCLCLRSYLCFGLSLSSLSCLRRTSGFVFVFVFIFVFIVVSHLEVFGSLRGTQARMARGQMHRSSQYTVNLQTAVNLHPGGEVVFLSSREVSRMLASG